MLTAVAFGGALCATAELSQHLEASEAKPWCVNCRRAKKIGRAAALWPHRHQSRSRIFNIFLYRARVPLQVHGLANPTLAVCFAMRCQLLNFNGARRRPNGAVDAVHVAGAGFSHEKRPSALQSATRPQKYVYPRALSRGWAADVTAARRGASTSAAARGSRAPYGRGRPHASPPTTHKPTTVTPARLMGPRRRSPSVRCWPPSPRVLGSRSNTGAGRRVGASARSVPVIGRVCRFGNRSPELDYNKSTAGSSRVPSLRAA